MRAFSFQSCMPGYLGSLVSPFLRALDCIQTVSREMAGRLQTPICLLLFALGFSFPRLLQIGAGLHSRLLFSGQLGWRIFKEGGGSRAVCVP